MKEDIIVSQVTQVAVAVVPRAEATEPLWDIYLINLSDRPLDNLLITSQGYGNIEGVDKSTTTLRHFHQRLRGQEAIRIEPIQSSLFGLTNEFWVSFNDGEEMLDKRYRFPAGSISEAALETLPVLDRPGVMIR